MRENNFIIVIFKIFFMLNHLKNIPITLKIEIIKIKVLNIFFNVIEVIKINFNCYCNFFYNISTSVLQQDTPL